MTISIRARFVVNKGGPGSGHHGHAGRPGKVGGSLPGKGNNFPFSSQEEYERAYDYLSGRNQDGTRRDTDNEWAIHNAYEGLKTQIERWEDKNGIYVGISNPKPRDDPEYWDSYVSHYINREQANYILDEFKKKSDARLEMLYEKSGLPERYEDFLAGIDFTKEHAWGAKADVRDPATELIMDRMSHVFSDMDMSSVSRNEIAYDIFRRYREQIEQKYGADSEEAKNAASWLWYAGDLVEHEHGFEVRKLVALGKITPEEGGKLGVYDAQTPQGGEWKPLPDTVWHVTTNSDAIVKDKIRSRREIGGRKAETGLAGGEDDTISFTSDVSIAKNIERSIHEAYMVAKGDVSVRKMLELAEMGAGAQQPFIAELVYMIAGSNYKDWKIGDELPPALQELIDMEEGKIDVKIPSWSSESTVKDYIASKRWDLYHLNFVRSRQWSGKGFEDPVFFGTNWKNLAKMNPKGIAILKFKSKQGARGYQMSGLGEWRTVGGDTVDLVEVINDYEPGDIDKILGIDMEGVVWQQ